MFVCTSGGIKLFLLRPVIWLTLSLVIATGFGAYAGVQAIGGPVTVESMLEIRHDNVVLQQWELSCAAAALATILRYQHGMPVTERSVALGLIDREEYIANPAMVRIRQGFSFLDLKRYVEEFGFNGVGLGQLTLPDIMARAPVIVPVNLQGFPHFVVVRGGTRHSLLIADPAFGNMTISQYKFLDAWIEYQDLGHVAFMVTTDHTPAPPGELRAKPEDFLLLR